MAPGAVKPFDLPDVPTGLMNVTDHDSRVVRTQGQPGMQGYNAQLAVNDRQIIVAAEITTESPKSSPVPRAMGGPKPRSSDGSTSGCAVIAWCKSRSAANRLSQTR
jgi:hypothetical protein